MSQVKRGHITGINKGKVIMYGLRAYPKSVWPTMNFTLGSMHNRKGYSDIINLL